ncbi:MAG: leucyl/phenylalanyl-tRNA--protein transferase [Magnetococcales bacterium]|nr:leucyl/phenylalanyl-tRNA--protein transferase [Magnetococcales bacterium]
MGVFQLSSRPVFPSPTLAEANGLLAVGGDLSPQRLLAAYAAGIFPWYSEGQPLLWWSPDPRLVLYPERFHASRTLRKSLRRQSFSVTFDRDFPQVIGHCRRCRQATGTWITPEMEQAYIRLHQLGYAHSVESWLVTEGEEPVLAGGLYGVALGGCFFGESMFYRHADGSKVAFAALAERLRDQGFSLIDCQMTTEHLLRLGAEEIPRAHFLQQLQHALRQFPIQPGPWC